MKASLLLRSLPVFVFLLLPVSVSAQNAGEMDAMLAADTVSAAKAARFILGAADLLDPGLSGPDAEEAACNLAILNGWIGAHGSESVTLKQTAFLVMKAFDLKGGIMYSLFGSPRYAYREMIYRKLITGHADNTMILTGFRLLQILDETISYVGESVFGSADAEIIGSQ